MNKKRVHIINDGQPGYMTRVIDAETGEDIPGASTVEMHFDASSGPVIAKITVYDATLDVTVDAEITTLCPCCRRPYEEQKS